MALCAFVCVFVFLWMHTDFWKKTNKQKQQRISLHQRWGRDGQKTTALVCRRVMWEAALTAAQVGEEESPRGVEMEERVEAEPPPALACAAPHTASASQAAGRWRDVVGVCLWADCKFFLFFSLSFFIEGDERLHWLGRQTAFVWSKVRICRKEILRNNQVPPLLPLVSQWDFRLP